MEDKRIQWYVVSTASGKELIAKQNIDTRIVTMEMQDFIFETLVVQEEVDVIRGGKPTGKTKLKNLYPRYLFIKMIMDDKAWFVVRNTPEVTGFVGSAGKGTKPIPVPKDEMNRILKLCGKYVDESLDQYKIGAKVRILRGSYQDLEGNIISVDKDTNQLVVEFLLMGRKATGSFSFTDIELI